MIRKLFIGLFAWTLVFGWSMSMVSASGVGWSFNNQDSTFNPWVSGAESWELTTSGLLTWIKNVVNFVLWVLSLIALIILLWWWFQMVTAAWNEEKYKKWFTILKQAWIWLALIWFSWLIVSFIFWLVIDSSTV